MKIMFSTRLSRVLLCLSIVMSINFQSLIAQEKGDSTQPSKKEKGGFIRNLSKSLSRGIGKAFTKKSGDLSEMVVDARFICNCYPKAFNMSNDEDFIYENLWKDGGNIISVRFMKKGGIAFIELEGSVSVDGQALPYLGSGCYGKAVSDLKPRTFVIETNLGQKAEITIKPTFPVSIITPRKSEVDFKKDLDVKLNNPPGSENTGIRLAVMDKPTSQVQWKTIDYYKSADEIVIPAAALLVPTYQGRELSESYLLAERYNLELPEIKGVGEVHLVSLYWDYAPLKAKHLGQPVFSISTGSPYKQYVRKKGDVTVFPTLMSVQTKEGSAKETPYKMGYSINKIGGLQNCRPLSRAKKFAVIAFTVRGTALTQEQTNTWTTQSTSSETEDLGNGWERKTTYLNTVTHTQTCKKEFPSLPKEWWDNLTGEMYQGFAKSLEQQGIELVPVEDVLKSASYADFPDSPDTLTDEVYISTYGGLKNIFGGGFSKNILAAVGIPQRRLQRELGVDGVITVSVDLAMPFGACSKEITLMPRMTYSISGPPNGYEPFPCSYANGSIWGNGVDLSQLKEKKEILSTNKKGKTVKDYEWVYEPDLLMKVVREESIFNAFSESLARMKQLEDEEGYTSYWTLKY